MRISRGYRFCFLALAVLAAGCQTRGDDRPLTSEVPSPPDFAPPPESCLAEGARFAFGLRISAPLLEEMRQRTGARSVRTVLTGAPPDAAAPDATRLNVQVEPNGRVVGANCR